MEKYIATQCIRLLMVILMTAPLQSYSAERFFDLEVIADHGGQPIDSYLPSGSRTKRAAIPPKIVDAHFPVRTTNMSVGPVGPTEGATLNHNILTRPFFIIGYDPTSIAWLKSNRAALSEHKAIGLVVNVENREQMNALQDAAGEEIALQPTPGDRLAKHFGIQHYPFYLGRDGVMR